MAKRFTDSEKWEKAWFRGIDTRYKLFWLYLLDECNLAGIWNVDFEVAVVKMGVQVDYDEALTILHDKITVIEKHKWLINDFAPFQYGSLKQSNRLHVKVEEMLKVAKETALRGVDTPKDKDKVLDKDKEGVQGGGKVVPLPNWLKKSLDQKNGSTK